tara:strand:- start:9993 stop:10766 length:774 start_codon:yes stop_codon:yes gene_type:complete
MSQSKKNPFNELVFGGIGGAFGTVCCYGPDTIKTRIQAIPNYSLLGDFRSSSFFKDLYRGIASPLISVAMEKSALFYVNEALKENTNMNSFQRGLLSGIATTIIVTPPERVKVRAQTSRCSTSNAFLNIIKKDGILSLYRGWSTTLFREVPGYGIYITVYEKLNNFYPGYNPLKSIGVGTAAGVTAWAIMYPSDPVKTIMQNENIGVKSAINNIYRTHGLMGFYKGYTWALMRAGILHSGVIFAYDTSKHLFGSKLN